MKVEFSPELLPKEVGLFLTCTNHEQRCLGILRDCVDWAPTRSILFRYDDTDPKGEEHRSMISRTLRRRCPVSEMPLSDITTRDGDHLLRKELRTCGDAQVVVDISVLSKRWLLLLLRCLDDYGFLDRLWILYSEPKDYEIEGQLPLSFGVSSVALLPGFAPSANPSRPVHLVMFLGYEGDRALSTYEILQPKRTSLVIPDPPFRLEWVGRTEKQNRNLLATIDDQSCVVYADAVDPMSTVKTLTSILGDVHRYSDFSRSICPLGTNPQAVGAYLYTRECTDPPSVIYSHVLRHNVDYYSRGTGLRWLIYSPV